MHENREISWTSCSKDQDRSAKAINRAADMNAQEKSDCAVVPVNQLNNGEQSSAEVGEGRAQTKGEHRSISHATNTEWGTCVPGVERCATARPRETRDLHVSGLHAFLWAAHDRTIHRLADYGEEADGYEAQSH